MRSLDTQLHPDHLKVITQQVEEEQAILQSQTLLRLQQVHAADRRTPSPQVGNAAGRQRLAPQITALLTKHLFLSAGAGSPGAHPPPHRHRPCARTYPALPSRYRGDHEPFRLHQHHVHVQTEPGHYRAGKSTETLPTLEGIELKFRIGGVELERCVAPSSGAVVSGQERC